MSSSSMSCLLTFNSMCRSSLFYWQILILVKSCSVIPLHIKYIINVNVRYIKYKYIYMQTHTPIYKFTHKSESLTVPTFSLELQTYIFKCLFDISRQLTKRYMKFNKVKKNCLSPHQSTFAFPVFSISVNDISPHHILQN